MEWDSLPHMWWGITTKILKTLLWAKWKLMYLTPQTLRKCNLLFFWEKVWKLGKYFCSDHGWPGILHQRGDRHWLIAPEYVSPGIRNIKRIPPLPRPTSTAYSQILFNSCWMSSLPQNLARSKLSERWTLHFSTSLSYEIRYQNDLKEINLARFWSHNTCLESLHVWDDTPP